MTLWEQLITPDFTRMSFWEIGMLICFGASWPAAIMKTIKAKNPTGKSMLFLWFVLIGYGCGCIHKLYRPDFVFWFYILNATMVTADIILVAHYTRLRRRAV